MNKPVEQQGVMVWLWALVLVMVGVLILLNNYFLLAFDIRQWWPVLLVVLGLQVLLQGDLRLSKATQSFGITRGSVEAGILRANSGELDMQISALDQPGRLVAGQYTGRSRPHLQTEGNQAVLSMDRSKTWLLSLADWDIRLAQDLPWTLLLTSFLGEIRADLRGLVLQDTRIATGISDIYVMLPDNTAGTLQIHSTLGNIELTLPDGAAVELQVDASRLFGIHLDNDHWQTTEIPGHYKSANQTSDDGMYRVMVRGTFGRLTLK